MSNRKIRPLQSYGARIATSAEMADKGGLAYWRNVFTHVFELLEGSENYNDIDWTTLQIKTVEREKPFEFSGNGSDIVVHVKGWDGKHDR